MSLTTVPIHNFAQDTKGPNGVEIHELEVQRALQPWQILALLTRDANGVDTQFWWQMTGSTLGILMEEAGYDLQVQYANLIFHLHYVIPNFGPVGKACGNTPAWKSFMTDDFSPVEYSWNWDDAKTGPKIRYSVEAISALAGTDMDPFNQAPSIELCTRLQNDIPDQDFSLIDILLGTFSDRSMGSACATTEDVNHSSPSSVFLAFELGSTIATKAYFVPVKAEQYGISRLAVLTEAIDVLRNLGYPFPGYDKFLEFARSHQASRVDIIGVAIDCVDPELSRFKIYVRSPETSFQSVCNMMSLGGSIGPLPESARKELKELWRLTLNLDFDFSESEEFLSDNHETKGMLYNFDIKPYDTSVGPKLYLPVKHYAKDDLAAARGLGLYLRARGRGRFFPNYMRALERICTHRGLADGRGLQTYIGTGIRKDGSLALCSYINGEVYHPNRLQV